MFTAFAVVAGFRIPDSWGTKLEISLMALGMAVAGVLAFSLVYALVVAPYEQRKALRVLDGQSGGGERCDGLPVR